MNQPLPRQHLYSHSQESQQVCQASIVLLNNIKVKVKLALLSAVTLLVAAIISSCGGSGGSTSTSTPTLAPISTLAPGPTATATSTATPTPTGTAIWELDVRAGPGSGYDVSFTLPAGTQFTLSARDSTEQWVEISTSDERTGWVRVIEIKIDPSVSIGSLPVSPKPINPLPIFQGNYALGYVQGLAPAYDMGVNTSGGLTNWVEVKPPLSAYDSSAIIMDYPRGQSWGAVFITVGKPTQSPRPGEDLSRYHKLSLELGGDAGGESVSIGIKDNNQPDNGSETKVSVSCPPRREGMKTFTFPLSRFTGADLHKLYVVIEFVFTGGTPENVWVGDIQYLL
jgi:hypothetical protein